MSSAVFIAEAGEDRYRHRFGGGSWTLEVPAGSTPAPLLLVTLDLADPRLGWDAPFPELPLALHVDDTLEPQRYTLDPAARRARFEGPAWRHETYVEPAAARVERALRLRPARGSELAADVIETLVGGSGCLRIGGAPVWLQGPERVECDCGDSPSFAASIGQQRFDTADGLMADGTALFLGELVAHFFACWRCPAVTVIAEST